MAVLEALPILSSVEMEEEGSLAREEAEAAVIERVSTSPRTFAGKPQQV